MAYSDYGGYAYKNGDRVVDRSDCVLSPEGIKSTPGMWPGWILPEGRNGGSYHALLGDGPIFAGLYKQSSLIVSNQGADVDLLPLVPDEAVSVWTDPKDGKVHRWLNDDHYKTVCEPLRVDIEGHKLTVYFLIEDNHYIYAELVQPDGNVWTGFSGYGVGAGLEAAGYGFSTEDRESRLIELFSKPETARA